MAYTVTDAICGAMAMQLLRWFIVRPHHQLAGRKGLRQALRGYLPLVLASLVVLAVVGVVVFLWHAESGSHTAYRILQTGSGPHLHRVKISGGFGNVAASEDPEVLEYFDDMLRRAKTFDEIEHRKAESVWYGRAPTGEMWLTFSMGRQGYAYVDYYPDVNLLNVVVLHGIFILDYKDLYVIELDDSAPDGVLELLSVFDEALEDRRQLEGARQDSGGEAGN